MIKIQVLAWILFLLHLSQAVFSQEACKEIYIQAEQAFKEEKFDRALTKLADNEICDINNDFESQRIELRDCIFSAIKRLRGVAEKSEEDAKRNLHLADSLRLTAEESKNEANRNAAEADSLKHLAQIQEKISRIQKLTAEAINQQNLGLSGKSQIDSAFLLNDSIRTLIISGSIDTSFWVYFYQNNARIYQAQSPETNDLKCSTMPHKADLRTLIPFNVMDSNLPNFFLASGESGYLSLLNLKFLEDRRVVTPIAHLRPRDRFFSSTRFFRSMAMDKGKKNLVAGDDMGNIFLWDIEEFISKMEKKKSNTPLIAKAQYNLRVDCEIPINTIIPLGVKEWIALRGDGKMIRLVLEQKEFRWTPISLEIEISYMAIHPNKKQILLWSNRENSLYLFDPRNQQPQLLMAQDMGVVSSLVVSSQALLQCKGSNLWIGNTDGWISQICLSDNSLSGPLFKSDSILNFQMTIQKLLVNVQGESSWIACLGAEGIVKVLPIEPLYRIPQDIREELTYDTNLGGWVWDAIYLPDRKILFASGVLGQLFSLSPLLSRPSESVINPPKIP